MIPCLYRVVCLSFNGSSQSLSFLQACAERLWERFSIYAIWQQRWRHQSPARKPANELDLLLPKFSPPLVNKMSLSTSRILKATSSEVSDATFLFAAVNKSRIGFRIGSDRIGLELLYIKSDCLLAVL